MARADEPEPEPTFAARYPLPPWVPTPDPTVLTTQALFREIGTLREYLEQMVAAERSSRASAAAEAAEQTRALDRLLSERILGLDTKVEQKFDLVERQRVEQKKDTKDAVDAALTAQKEAVREQTIASERAIAKSETATNKTLEQQQQAATTAVESLRRSIDENKERIVEVDRNARQGLSDTASAIATALSRASGSREGVGDLRSAALLGLAILAGALAIYSAVVR